MINEEKINKLSKLINNFKLNYNEYKSNKYNEEKAKIDFIDKLFALLDWDMNNEQGYSEAYREVLREDIVNVKGQSKNPDYTFKIGRERKFFVEAKKPSIFIKEDILASYQLRSYAHSAKLSLSILTDFEEFSIYDTRIAPKPDDKASNSRIFYINFEEYIKQFEYIYNIFSKPAILQGSFDKYEIDNKNKQGTTEVDKEILSLIENWRLELSKIIALRNFEINKHDIIYAVQKIIDRIIFLRIAEDKGTETQRRLFELAASQNIYSELVNIFIQADKKYNSGLFENKEWLNKIIIDDKVLKSIILDIYYPKCHYKFSVIPIEILGIIYEKFLGKTIRLTESHQAKVEDKLELTARRAGGVYYTPQYIVFNVVENTVGKMIKGKSPDSISKIKILDPACGSGSFLVGAYTYLIDYQLDYYLKLKDKSKLINDGKIYKTGENKYKLTLSEKQKILLENIFGVDIDEQAVEVTKLSLLLKLMEDENEESQSYIFASHDLGLLPKLDNNIKCGNSLVNKTYYKNKNLNLFKDEEIQKINAFSWEEEFPEIMKNGGFDVIIGNPPYIKEYTYNEPFLIFKEGDLKKYYEGKMDIWYAFACLSIDLLKENGLHSFIASNNWITSSGASILRNKILSETKILKFIDFLDFKVFQDASIQTMIYVIQKTKITKPYEVIYTKITNPKMTESELSIIINQPSNIKSNNADIGFLRFEAKINPEYLKYKTFTFVNSEIDTVLEKIRSKSNFILNEKEVANGIHTHHSIVTKQMINILGDNYNIGDGIFVINEKEKKSLNFTIKENELIKPVYNSENLYKYYANKINKYWIIYTDSSFKDSRKINDYQNIKNHLDKFKKVITSDNKPYGLHRSRDEYFFKDAKIAVIRKCSIPTFTYIDFNSYILAEYYIIKTKGINLKYLTGLLNSKLIYFWLYYKGKKQGDQLQIDKEPLLDIPIIKTDDEKLNNQMVNLVDQMIDVQKKYHEAKTDGDKKLHKQKIEIIDKQIDELVYKLYGLTEDEIKIIEGY